jgi:hypothetical protein
MPRTAGAPWSRSRRRSSSRTRAYFVGGERLIRLDIARGEQQVMVVDAKGRIWYGAQPYFRAGYVRVRTEAEKAAALSR